MIKFCGEMAEKTQKFVVKADAKAGATAAIIVCCAVAVPITLLTVFNDSLFAIAYALLPFCAIFFSLPLPRRKRDTVCATSITIEENVIGCEGKDFTCVRAIEDIKKIVDYGDFYQIIFYFPHKSIVFVCQKDLITKGTIEEFEQRFADHIVRKTN